MKSSLALLRDVFECGIGERELVDIFGSDWVRDAKVALKVEARTEHLRESEDGILSLRVRALSGREADDMRADFAYWDGHCYLPLHLPEGEGLVRIPHREWMAQVEALASHKEDLVREEEGYVGYANLDRRR
jgi:hypothetical protein